MTRTPWQVQRDEAESSWPQLWGWGPFHRHFCNDAIHRDNHPAECDQPGTPRRVYVFDPENLDAHELIVARYAIAHPEQFKEEDVMCTDSGKPIREDIRDAIVSFPGYPADPGFAFATALAGDLPGKLAEHIAVHLTEAGLYL